MGWLRCWAVYMSKLYRELLRKMIIYFERVRAKIQTVIFPSYLITAKLHALSLTIRQCCIVAWSSCLLFTAQEIESWEGTTAYCDWRGICYSGCLSSPVCPWVLSAWPVFLSLFWSQCFCGCLVFKTKISEKCAMMKLCSWSVFWETVRHYFPDEKEVGERKFSLI